MYRNICSNFWVDTYIFSYRKVILNFVLLLRRTSLDREALSITRPPWNLSIDWIYLRREKRENSVQAAFAARALGCSLLPHGKEKCGVLYNSNWWREIAYLYKRNWTWGPEFRLVPRSFQFLLEKKESLKKKGIVTLSFSSFDSFLNAWNGDIILHSKGRGTSISWHPVWVVLHFVSEWPAIMFVIVRVPL